MPKNRTFDQISEYTGGLENLICERLKSNDTITILDAGCGIGISMLGIKKRWGDRIKMIGFNYSTFDGKQENLAQEALKQGVLSEKELSEIEIPSIHYCDASKKLPFEDNSIDIIYSVAAMYLFDDKINFLQECNRIMKPKGIARVNPSIYSRNHGISTHYSTFWEIWDQGKEVKLWDYCNRIKGVSFKWGEGEMRKRHAYIEIAKQEKELNFKLKLLSAIDYNLVYRQWGGVKSIYTTQNKFVPRYKLNQFSEHRNLNLFNK